MRDVRMPASTDTTGPRVFDEAKMLPVVRPADRRNPVAKPQRLCVLPHRQLPVLSHADNNQIHILRAQPVIWMAGRVPGCRSGVAPGSDASGGIRTVRIRYRDGNASVPRGHDRIRTERSALPGSSPPASVPCRTYLLHHYRADTRRASTTRDAPPGRGRPADLGLNTG